jgi:hypothetical protein
MPRAQAAFPRSGERSHWTGTECALATEAAGGTYSLADLSLLIRCRADYLQFADQLGTTPFVDTSARFSAPMLTHVRVPLLNLSLPNV